MDRIGKIEQLAKELVSGSLAPVQYERKSFELIELMLQEGRYRENSKADKNKYDGVSFAEAFAAALKLYVANKERKTFWEYFQSCYWLKLKGAKAESFKEQNAELYAYRLEQLKVLIEKIGKSEGIDYQDYKNRLRYPNEEKVMEQLQKWQVADKYAQDVKDIFTGSNFVSMQKLEEVSETHESNVGQLPLAIVEQDEAMQLRIADIIEVSYELSKQKKLYDLNRCEWSGNLYETYSKIIPMLFASYLEKGYLTFYETQALLAILDNKLFAAYLHMAPDTIRKKRKQLEGINIAAMREVTTANRNKVEAYD